MARIATIEIPVRTVLDDEDRRRLRAVANALTKAGEAAVELAEAFAALADGGRVLDEEKKPVVGDREEDVTFPTVAAPLTDEQIGGFRVGDRIRAIEGGYIGQEGVITDLDFEDAPCPFLVDFDGGPAGWWKERDAIEHVR